jgi:hypothetical protein
MTYYFRPKKRSFFEKIPFYIYKHFYLLKVFFQANINYYFKIFFINNTIKCNKIAVLLPSKARAQKFLRLIKSITKHTFDKSRLDIMILLDKDEKQKKKYEKYKKYYLKKNLRIKIFYKDLPSHCSRNNFLASRIKSDLYFLMNDDAIFTYKNWDNYVDLISSKINNQEPYVIFIKTIGHNIPSYVHSDFPIVNNAWYKTLKYIGNKYTYGMIDAWINELAILSNKYIITKVNILRHLNSRIINEKIDETTKSLLIEQKDDWSIWENTKKIRLKDAKKLL